MRWRFTALLAFLAAFIGSSSSAQDGNGKRLFTLDDAIQVLVQVPEGKRLVTKSLHFWQLDHPSDLTRVLAWGSASRTDAVLTRHFNPATGKEDRERKIMIYVRRDQPLKDVVLDIAHEMVHATSPPSWDPYDPGLTAGRYIHAAIEGEGGEVEAVAAECQVGLELMASFGTTVPRCRSYVSDVASTIDKEKIRRDFYRVGRWSGEIFRKLGREVRMMPLLSPEKPKLYSSTGNAPYPIALMREFEQITEVACSNTRRRVEDAADRTLASAQDFLVRRCKTAVR